MNKEEKKVYQKYWDLNLKFQKINEKLKAKQQQEFTQKELAEAKFYNQNYPNIVNKVLKHYNFLVTLKSYLNKTYRILRLLCYLVFIVLIFKCGIILIPYIIAIILLDIHYMIYDFCEKHKK